MRLFPLICLVSACQASVGSTFGSSFLVEDPHHRVPVIAFEVQSEARSFLLCGISECSKLVLPVDASAETHLEALAAHFAAAIVPYNGQNVRVSRAHSWQNGDRNLLAVLSSTLHGRKAFRGSCSGAEVEQRLVIWRKDCSTASGHRSVVPLFVELVGVEGDNSQGVPVLRLLDDCPVRGQQQHGDSDGRFLDRDAIIVDVPVRIDGGVICVLRDVDASVTQGQAAAQHGLTALDADRQSDQIADDLADEAASLEPTGDAAGLFAPSTRFSAELSRAVEPAALLATRQWQQHQLDGASAAAFLEVGSGASAAAAAAASAADAALAVEVAAAQARFPIPGLSSILKIGMKVLMPPVFDPVLAKTKQHMEHTLSQTLGKDTNSATPKDTAAMLEPDLRRNLTALLVDTVTSAVTQPTSTRLTDTLAPPTIAASVGAAQASLVDSLTDSLQQLLSLKLGRSLPTALFRSLRSALVPALTKSLTHTLVPTLSRALKPHAVRHAGATGGPAASAAEMGATGLRIAPWEPTAAADVGVAIDHALATCLRQAAAAAVAGLPPGAPVADPAASGSAASPGAVAAAVPAVSDPFECWAALSKTAEYGDLYVAHYAASYYGAHAAAYARSAVAAVDALQFRDNVP